MFAIVSKDIAGQTIQLFKTENQAKEFIRAWELEKL